MNCETCKCPKCGGTDFERWELPHPLILHWVLNPGLAFNEVVLGQRMPKTMLICRACRGPVLDRGYIPCPTCGAMHLSRLVSGRRAFGNWRGFACAYCKAPIPCLWNVFSILILVASFPLWFIPHFLYFRGQPLRPLFRLVDGKAPTPPLLTVNTWVMMGALFGGCVWVYLAVFQLPVVSDRSIWGSAMFALPLAVVAGTVFALLMWVFLGRTSIQEGTL